jgi:3-deoxy-D-manno-octulosonic-acid transferase
VEIGVPAARVETGGNLKFDVRSPESGIAVLEALRAHLPEGAGVVVCGSTLEGEEAALLNAWPGVVKQAPRSVMLLAPRHPERFGEVAELLRTRGAVYAQRSKWMRAPGPIAPGSVFLLDSIGELAAVYQLGAVAFVGGSLVPAGGHNPLEPAQFGVPVVMGPSYENFRAIVEFLRAAGGVEIISTEELGPALVRLLEDRSAAEEAGARARAVFEREAGATERGVRAALGLLESGRA